MKLEAQPVNPVAEVLIEGHSVGGQQKDTPDNPVAGPSGTSGGDWGKVAKPRRYRSVSKEVGTGPEGEILLKNVLEAIGESDDSGEEEIHDPEREKA